MVLTYPPTELPVTFVYNYTSFVSNMKGPTNQVYTTDMFEGNQSTPNRIVLMQPIFNKKNQTIAILGLQFDADAVMSDRVNQNLGSTFPFNEVRVYAAYS